MPIAVKHCLKNLRNIFLKKILQRLTLFAMLLFFLSCIVCWIAYDHIGKTPGELMDYAELRLQGHPRIELIALPVISITRDWLDQPALNERLQQRFFIPKPPIQETVVVRNSPMDAKGTIRKIWRVGPKEEMTNIAQASIVAKDGDVVEIQAGVYRADVAVWNQKNLTIRGVGGTARIFADGKSAEDKAIWVIRNGDFNIENIDFISARAVDLHVKLPHGASVLNANQHTLSITLM